jgi:hypothetical protein
MVRLGDRWRFTLDFGRQLHAFNDSLQLLDFA